MLWLDMLAVPLLARICLVTLFPFSALDKIFHWKDALKQADSSFLPGGPALLAVAIVIELAAPACIIFAWHDRLAAFVLALFCIATAFLYHPFWKFHGFWFGNNTAGRAHFWDFLKNFGLVGGLLLLVIGARPMPASTVIDHPLSSAPLAASPPVSAQQSPSSRHLDSP